MASGRPLPDVSCMTKSRRSVSPAWPRRLRRVTSPKEPRIRSLVNTVAIWLIRSPREATRPVTSPSSLAIACSTSATTGPMSATAGVRRRASSQATSAVTTMAAAMPAIRIPTFTISALLFPS
ncbi:hypothetical protein BMS3Abin02_00412 [bacterium BMS3Abin02]|nr:hypothetical protein BMS3Abin02_00412 [bacterium BMS3Abin02]GBE23375.1 hypothetical protein BMS3Bbin01_02759 [bacterium BMS3Bbin01]